jgi:L-fuculose-phosphate aldolase
MDTIIAVIIEVCHRIDASGFVSATDGNVSVRSGAEKILTTRTAVNKGMVTAEDIVEVDLDGKALRPGSQPSTEIGMHCFIYARRPDVGAVVHAHPPYATGFATARQPLSGCIFPEVIVGLGTIPLAEYATPSTREVADSLAPYVQTADAILLANHGVVTYGKDLWDACFKMEKVEHAAKITFIARLLGGETRLSGEDVEKLRAISQSVYGKSPRAEMCAPREKQADAPASTPTEEELRAIVRQMINGNR